MEIDKKKSLIILFYVFEYLMISLLILLLVFKFGGDIRTSIVQYQYNDYELIDSPIGDNPYIDYDIFKFNDFIKNNFEYSVDNKDCKFYSFLYSYWAYNHGWSYEYILTNNHVFVNVYNSEMYCIADMNTDVICREYLN